MQLVKLLTVFFLLYDINFLFLPGFTTARLVFILFSFLIILEAVTIRPKFKISIYKEYFAFLLLFIVVVAVACIQFVFSKDITQVARLIYFLVYGFITPFILRRLMSSRKEFVTMVFLSVFIQSVLTLAAYFNPLLKDVLKSIVLFNSNFADENTIRAFGFVSVGGAAFSLIQFTGVASALYLIRNFEIHWLKKIFIWLGIATVLLSLVFIGRTGLFLSLAAIGVFVFSYKISFQYISLVAITVATVYHIDFFWLLDRATANIEGFNIDFLVAWLDSGFRLDNDLVQGLSEMPIPPLSLETVLGTGLVMHPSGFGNASGHDSGYVQTYFSLGLIFAIVFYLNYYLMLLFSVKRTGDWTGFLLVLVLIFVESKEFFVFSYTFPLFVFSFLLISNEKNHFRIQ